MRMMSELCKRVKYLFYFYGCYELWSLCQYGGVHSHKAPLVVSVVGFFLLALLAIVFGFAARGRETKEERILRKKKYRWVRILEGVFVLLVTLCFGGMIAYSAIPYHGALSWKVEEWKNKKQVELVHDNYLENGVDGILQDLDDALTLPEELYIANEFQVTFNWEGTITSLYTFLYGLDEEGNTLTYLVDYDADSSKKMTVWMNGEATTDYSQDVQLTPMMEILDKVENGQDVVTEWNELYSAQEYEILYYGKREFTSADGLAYVNIAGDGTGADTEYDLFGALTSGGVIRAYEVSLYIPSMNEVTPVRYVTDAAYYSQQTLDAMHEENELENAVETNSWIIDSSDGTMYYFLDESVGWRLVITDAAAGSRYYELEYTVDEGENWKKINTDPFLGRTGVSAGLLFEDENNGYIAITNASGENPSVYVTSDGGESFYESEVTLEKLLEMAGQ